MPTLRHAPPHAAPRRPHTPRPTPHAPRPQGWCVDKIDYIWKMHDIKLTVDMCDSKKKYKGVWLDGPCTAPDYDGVPCARSITVDIATGSVMKQYKGPSPLEPLC